jgi:hypothetical protein
MVAFYVVCARNFVAALLQDNNEKCQGNVQWLNCKCFKYTYILLYSDHLTVDNQRIVFCPGNYKLIVLTLS